MIFDNIRNWKQYHFPEAFRQVFEFLETKCAGLENGTYELQGRDSYAMIQSYRTMPELPDKLETHREYIDVQYWIAGSERMAVCPADGLSVQTPYNPEKDVEFKNMPNDREAAYVDVKPGDFMVLFPQDGHYGKIAAPKDGGTDLKKAVVKIRVKLF